MNKESMLEKAMSMIPPSNTESFDPVRDLKDLLPQIVEHLVMEATGVRDGEVLKSAAIKLRPRCKHDILLYSKQMQGVYAEISNIYDYIASNGKETPSMVKFIDQIRFYERATGMIGRSGCQE